MWSKTLCSEPTATVRHMPDTPSSAGRDLRDLVDPVVVSGLRGLERRGATRRPEPSSILPSRTRPSRSTRSTQTTSTTFRSTGPRVALTEDDEREITWPTTELKIAQLPDGRDLILVEGLEPNLRWRQFSTMIASALSSANVTRVHLLGALLADTPHTRPIPVSVSTPEPRVDDEARPGATDLRGSDRHHRRARRHLWHARAWKCSSLWSAIPHYVSHPPCPKATLALLSQLERVLDASLRSW